MARSGGRRTGDRFRPVRLIAGRAVADARRRSPSSLTADRAERIDAALDWLLRAQDEGPDRGFSYGYTVRGGWQPSYVETTGYIICSFLAAAEGLGRPDLTERAWQAGEWLCRVQLDDGGFPNPALDPAAGVVFDTGQDLHGLVSLARHTGESPFGAAAHRAARWLVDVADDNGRWTRNTFNGLPHVYNTRTAWALVRAGRLFDEDDALTVARANLDWACGQQRPNGWFDRCAFTEGAPPYTHTTAYAGRGLLEAGLLLGDERYVGAARRVADAASRHLRTDDLLPGRVGVDDRAASASSCLTGNLQFAIIWLRLAAHDHAPAGRRIAARVIDAVGRHQALDGPHEIRGAIKGSHPIWGRYAPLGYPNWATKFFLDALVLLGVDPGHGEVPA